MTEVAPETIQAPDDERIELSTTRGHDQAVERRPRLLGTRDTMVDVLLSLGPATRREVLADVEKLVLGVLVRRGDAGVEDSSHRIGSSLIVAVWLSCW